MVEVAVIGGGPAGLRAAEILSKAGKQVVLFDQKRSVGRKFLVAGKSGLNLTNDVSRNEFLAVYRGVGFPKDLWAQIYDNFDNQALREWAAQHGQETFVSSGRKVFPRSMKAAPLLRRWVQTIKEYSGIFELNHAFQGIEPIGGGYELRFITPDGERRVQAKYVVFALGGGSWPQTGSGGTWLNTFSSDEVRELQSANCGWELEWSPEFLEQYEGKPWKNILCKAGGESLEGELVITRYGLEGGPIYRLGHALRQMPDPVLEIDFKPTFSAEALLSKAESVKRNLLQELPQRWKVPASLVSLLSVRYPEIFAKKSVPHNDLSLLANEIKSFKIPLLRPRPIAEAISSAGGIRWSALDDSLQFKRMPYVYACGEMLDWEAPTGGFLLQGCMSSATWVAKQILDKA